MEEDQETKLIAASVIFFLVFGKIFLSYECRTDH